MENPETTVSEAKSFKKYYKYGFVILAILIIGAGSFWFVAKNKTQNEQTGDQTGKIQNNLPPAPNIEKEIVITAKIPDEVKKIATDNILKLREKIKANPLVAENWVIIGIYYKTIGDYDSVVAVWEYAKALDPQNFVPFNNLGDLYGYYLKDPKRAEENFTKALELAPGNQVLLRSVYDFYRFIMKDEAKANAILKRGEQLTP
jgi:tetratricopeptide (TPR) repeat protein